MSNCQSSACYLTAQHNPTTLSSFPAASLLLSTPSHNPVRSHIQFKHSLISQRHRKKKAGVLLRVCVFVCLCVCGLRLKQQRQLSGDKEKDDLHDFCRTRCRLPPSENNNSGYFNFWFHQNRSDPAVGSSLLTSFILNTHITIKR